MSPKLYPLKQAGSEKKISGNVPLLNGGLGLVEVASNLSLKDSGATCERMNLKVGA